MDKNIGYLILVVSIASLAINTYRLIAQRKMVKAVCEKLQLAC